MFLKTNASGSLYSTNILLSTFFVASALTFPCIAAAQIHSEPAIDIGEMTLMLSDGYRVCSCSVTCPGGGTLTTSVTSDNCQAGFIGGVAANGCYAGSVGDKSVQKSNCTTGNVISTELKDPPGKLKKNVNPGPNDFKD